MTGGEMERAIEFLLDTQARTDARLSAGFGETNRQIAETDRQLAETGRRLDSFAGTQAALMRVAAETFAAQNRINEDVRLGIEQLRLAQEAAWAAIRQVSDRQDRAEASVERLNETVRGRAEGDDETSRG